MEKTIVKIEAEKQIKTRLRVCAYARVSKDKDTMLHSLSAQVSYYNKYINKNPEWEFKGIFADYAFTGTKEDRPEFMRMLELCEKGEVDLIITKSISRFARNTETVLKTIRYLKSINVDVYFEEQRMHTISKDGEFMLATLAAFYQEESRSTSENMKWRIKKDMQQGIIWGGCDNFGYTCDKDNKTFIINEEQAKVVRRMFEMYASGMGFQKIANILNKEGIKPMYAKEWTKNNASQILANSNYTGDLILQKTYRRDYLTKKTIINKGEMPKYLIEGNHEPIISKELFDKVQELRKERATKYDLTARKNKNNYPFTSIFRCGCCGGAIHHKTTKYNTFWLCSTYNRKGKEFCSSSKQIDEAKLYEAINEYFGWDEFIPDKFKAKVLKMVAKENNEIVIYLDDGTVDSIYWKDKSRRESWTNEMKELARLRTLELNKGGKD